MYVIISNNIIICNKCSNQKLSPKLRSRGFLLAFWKHLSNGTLLPGRRSPICPVELQTCWASMACEVCQVTKALCSCWSEYCHVQDLSNPVRTPSCSSSPQKKSSESPSRIQLHGTQIHDGLGRGRFQVSNGKLFGLVHVFAKIPQTPKQKLKVYASSAERHKKKSALVAPSLGSSQPKRNPACHHAGKWYIVRSYPHIPRNFPSS